MAHNTTIEKPVVTHSTASPGRMMQRVLKWGWLLPLVVGILAYADSLNAFWVGDDYNYVVPKTLDTVIRFFDLRGRAAYRPINWVTWALDYAIFGTEPFGWKATSLLLHLITTILILVLVKDLVSDWVKRHEVVAASPFIALLPLITATLFAVQPSHPETVTWTGGRADVAFAPFLFLGAWAFVRWRRGDGRLWYALAFVGVVCSILGKEAGMIAAPALLILDLFALGAAWSKRTDVLALLRVHIPLFLPPVFYALLRLYLVSIHEGRLMYGADTHLQFGENLIDSALGYLLLGVGWWGAPVVITGWSVVLKVVLLLATLALAVLLVRWLKRPALFAVLWIPITVAVTYDQATPRWFYVGSFGACLLIGMVVVALPLNKARPAMVWGPALALTVIWGLVTAEYNYRWYQSGEIARGLINDIRALHPNPPLPATFYMGNAPYGYRDVLLFNSGFGQAPSYAYQDYTDISGWELQEHYTDKVKPALADPTQLGPNPFYLRYENGKIVEYPSLQALVAAQP